MFGPANLALLIPILAMMIPIVAILAAHQRRMTEIIHRNQAANPAPELAQLRAEMQELKELMHQQAISLDSTLARVVSGEAREASRIEEA